MEIASVSGHSGEEKTEKKAFDSEDFTLRKRAPPKLPRSKTDVYVTRKSSFKYQLEKCKDLLDHGEDVIFIHGLGAAINRAINLAVQLRTIYCGTVDIDVNTSTVEVVDDYAPDSDDLKMFSQNRNASAVHIRLFKVKRIA